MILIGISSFHDSLIMFFLEVFELILCTSTCSADGEDQAAFFGLREAGGLIFDTNIGIIIVNK